MGNLNDPMKQQTSLLGKQNKQQARQLFTKLGIQWQLRHCSLQVTLADFKWLKRMCSQVL